LLSQLKTGCEQARDSDTLFQLDLGLPSKTWKAKKVGLCLKCLAYLEGLLDTKTKSKGHMAHMDSKNGYVHETIFVTYEKP